MSIGFSKSRQTTNSSGSSSNQSQSGPTSPAQANEFFYALDALTGGTAPTTTTRQVPAAAPAASPTDGMWSYQGQVFSDEQSARAAALGDGWGAGAVPLDGSGTSFFGRQGRERRANSQGGQQYETVTETTEGSPGRLAQWARDGSAPVDYGYQAPTIAYQGLTADQVRAAGGAGATRLLGAQQVYGDRADQLRADPSMTLLQRNYAGGLNTRELGQTSDAINKEAEAAITALMSHQADKALEAQTLDAAGKKAVADAVYAAGVRNSDLTSRDLKDLADIYTRMFGQYSTSSGANSNTSTGKTSGSSFGVSLW